jgi:hypothetical protein
VSNGPRHQRRRPTHDRLYVGRVRRSTLPDGIVLVSLDLMRDGDVAELAEGDEFVTLYLSVDPFLPRPADDG